MLYHIERFLKPFRLLLALHITEEDEFGRNPVPVTKVETTSSTTIAIPAPISTSATVPATAEMETRVGWVYKLSKPQVEAELIKFGVQPRGNANQLRAELVRLLRREEITQHEPEDEYQETNPGMSAQRILELEAMSIREILGLPPDADFNDVKKLMTKTSKPKLAATTSYNFPTGATSLAYQGVRTITEIPERQNVMFTPAKGKSYAPVFTPYRQSENHDTPEKLLRWRDPDLDNASGPSQQDEDEQRNPQSYRDPQFVCDDETKRISTTASTCSVVRKWNLRFDGRKDADAISFLERLNELMTSYGVSHNMMLKALPELFKDSALLWYRNNRDCWSEFMDFVRDFQIQYLPPGYLINLDDEIRNRTQGEGELFKQYVVAISTLIRRRGGFSEVEKLDRVYKNMHPSYKIYVRQRDFVNLAGLIKVAGDYETFLRDKSNYRPPPNPAQALVPETAFQGKSRPTYRSTHPTAAVETTRSADTNERRHPDGWRPNFQNFRQYNSRNGAKNEGRYPLRTPEDRRLEHRSQTRRVNFSDENRTSAPKICWNCDKTGHIYRYCSEPKTLKCFNCKKPGERTTTCGCNKPGNEQRTMDHGGHRSPRPEQVQRPPPTN